MTGDEARQFLDSVQESLSQENPGGSFRIGFKVYSTAAFAGVQIT